MKKLILPVVIIGAIAALYFFGKSRLSNIKVLFSSIKFTGGIIKPRFLLNFMVQNPSTESANVKNLVGSLTANDKVIADISNFTPQTIPASGQTIYQVEAIPNAFSIVSTITNFLKSGNKIKFNFNGSMLVDNINVPVNQNVTM